jgi:hypothetical protein
MGMQFGWKQGVLAEFCSGKRTKDWEVVGSIILKVKQTNLV